MMRSRSLSATHRFIGGRTSTAIGYLGGRMRESTRGRRGTQEQLSPVPGRTELQVTVDTGLANKPWVAAFKIAPAAAAPRAAPATAATAAAAAVVASTAYLTASALPQVDELAKGNNGGDMTADEESESISSNEPKSTALNAPSDCLRVIPGHLPPIVPQVHAPSMVRAALDAAKHIDDPHEKVHRLSAILTSRFLPDGSAAAERRHMEQAAAEEDANPRAEAEEAEEAQQPMEYFDDDHLLNDDGSVDLSRVSVASAHTAAAALAATTHTAASALAAATHESHTAAATTHNAAAALAAAAHTAAASETAGSSPTDHEPASRYRRGTISRAKLSQELEDGAFIDGVDLHLVMDSKVVKNASKATVAARTAAVAERAAASSPRSSQGCGQVSEPVPPAIKVQQFVLPWAKKDDGRPGSANRRAPPENHCRTVTRPEKKKVEGNVVDVLTDALGLLGGSKEQAARRNLRTQPTPSASGSGTPVQLGNQTHRGGPDRAPARGVPEHPTTTETLRDSQGGKQRASLSLTI